MTDAQRTVFEGVAVAGHIDGRGILTRKNGERDIGVFKEKKGRLMLLYNIGPSLYERCNTHCSSTTLSCTNMQARINAIRPDDPFFAQKAQIVAVTCASDTKICENYCERQNASQRELFVDFVKFLRSSFT